MAEEEQQQQFSNFKDRRGNLAVKNREKSQKKVKKIESLEKVREGRAGRRRRIFYFKLLISVLLLWL